MSKQPKSPALEENENFTEDKKKGFNLFGLFKKKSDPGRGSYDTKTIKDVGSPIGHKSLPEDLKKPGIVVKKLRPIFGVDFGDLMERETKRCPRFVIDLIDALRKRKAESIEGIFRISGMQEEIDDLVIRYESKEDVDLMKVRDIHIVTNILKLYFRSLPSPLLTYGLYSEFIKIPTIEDQGDKIKYIIECIDFLSPSRKYCLGLVLDLCWRIQLNQRINMMTCANLAVVFGVNLLKLKEQDPMKQMQANQMITRTFEDLISLFDQYKYIFGDLENIFDEQDPGEDLPPDNFEE